MWMVAGMNKKFEGPLGNYDVLSDRSLTNYFSSPSIRQHLIGLGLIRKDGSIIPESVYRRRHQELMRKRLAHEALASAIVRKSIDLEKIRQSQVQRHLEDLTKVEIVERIRSARSHKRTKSAPLLSNNEIANQKRGNSSPPTAGRQRKKKSNSSRRRENVLTSTMRPSTANRISFEDETVFDEIEKDDNGSSLASSHSADEIITLKERPKSAHPRHREKHNMALETIEKHLTDSTNSLLTKSVSPYLRPLMSAEREGVLIKKHRYKSAVGPRTERHPVTINELLDWSSDDNAKKLAKSKKKKKRKPKEKLKEQNKEVCELTLKYLGSNPHLKNISESKGKQDVCVFQQHCGGSSIPIYKGKLSPGDTFTFSSRRQRGFPFSATIFIDGIKDLRLSTCCEYRHPANARLGGSHGHFVLLRVRGNEPCIRCHAEKNFGLERPRHPLPKGAKSKGEKEDIEMEKSSLTDLKKSNSVSSLQQLEISSCKPEVIKIQPFSHQPDITADAVVPENSVKTIDVEEKDLISDSTIQTESVKSHNNEEEDETSSESVEEEIQSSIQKLPEAGENDTYSEDAMPGEYETAEFSHNELTEDEEDDSTDDDDDVFEGEDEKSDKEVPPLKAIKPVIVRTPSAQNRVSLPNGHWGARRPSLAPSYSSDDDDMVVKKLVSVITADVHANASNSEVTSLNSNCPSPNPP